MFQQFSLERKKVKKNSTHQLALYINTVVGGHFINQILPNRWKVDIISEAHTLGRKLVHLSAGACDCICIVVTGLSLSQWAKQERL